jgi:hypothetical protein
VNKEAIPTPKTGDWSKEIYDKPAATKPTLMARLAKLQQKLFLTPAQSRAAAQAQLDRINLVLAGERQALRDSILMLVAERTKTTKLAFEVKLTINRAALDTLIGDDAAVHIALAVAKRIIAQHEKLKANTVKRGGIDMSDINKELKK